MLRQAFLLCFSMILKLKNSIRFLPSSKDSNMTTMSFCKSISSFSSSI